MGISLIATSSQYISMADSNDFNLGTGDFSIGWFVNWATDPNAASGGFIGQADDTSNRIVFGATNVAGINAQLTLTVVSGAVVQAAYNELLNTLVANQWYHIAWVRQGTNVFLYIDAVSQALTVSTGIGTNALPNLAATFDIGRAFFNGAQQYFTGKFSEVFLLKGYALTDVDIANLAKSRVKGICKQISPANLVLYLPLDDFSDASVTSGTNTFKDRSTSNVNDGSPNASPIAVSEEILAYQ